MALRTVRTDRLFSLSSSAWFGGSPVPARQWLPRPHLVSGVSLTALFGVLTRHAVDKALLIKAWSPVPGAPVALWEEVRSLGAHPKKAMGPQSLPSPVFPCLLVSRVLYFNTLYLTLFHISRHEVQFHHRPQSNGGPTECDVNPETTRQGSGQFLSSSQFLALVLGD